MKKAITMVVVLAMASFYLNGCGPSPEAALKKAYSPSADKDVTASAQYNFLSFSGTVWKTKVKVAVADMKRYTGAPEVKLLSPEFFEPTHPRYRPPADSKIIAVLPPGTHLRIGRLMQDQGVWGGVQVEAVLLDGTNSEKAVFLDGYFLAGNRWSRGPASNKSWDINPEMLEEATGASTSPGKK